MRETVKNVLGIADNHGCQSIAISAISSGVFGFPKRLCAKEMFDEFEKFAQDHQDFSSKCDNLERVEVVIIDELTFDTFKDEFEWRYIKLERPKPDYFYLYDSSHYSSSS